MKPHVLIPFLFSLLVSLNTMAQNSFNCLSAGDQQWTAFFLGRDAGKIINNSSYTVKFTVAGKSYSLAPNETIKGTWINEDTRMENCESTTCDGFLLSNMKSAVYLRYDLERFTSNLKTPTTNAECDQQYAAVSAKLKEFRGWKSKTPSRFWTHISGQATEEACERALRGIEEQRKDIQRHNTANNRTVNAGNSASKSVENKQVTNATVTTTNNNSKKVSPEEAKRQADKIMADLQAQQDKREAESKQLAEGVSQLTSVGLGMYNQLAADRERAQESRYRTEKELKAIISDYKDMALQGNEVALKKVNDAYIRLANINDQDIRYGSNHDSRRDMLKSVMQNKASGYAAKLLVGYYESIKLQEMRDHKKALNRLIFLPVIGGGLIYGGAKSMDWIDDETTGTVVASVACIGGGVLAFWGLVQPIGLLQNGKRSREYKDADQNIKEIKNNYSVSIYPSYDIYTKSYLASIRFKF